LKLDIDYSKKIPTPEYYICRNNIERTVISKINDIDNDVLQINFGGIHELNFDVPLEIESQHEMIKNPNLSYLLYKFLIKVNLGSYEDYFIIEKPNKEMTDKEDLKHINCFSLAYELKDKNVDGYNVTSKSIEQIFTGFIDENNVTWPSLLYQTDWTLGYVDSDASILFRSLEMTGITLLDAILEIATTFSCIVDFDSVNKTINFYNPDNKGIYRGINFSYGNYLQSLSYEPDYENACSILRVYGKDGLSINEYNVTGTNFLRSFIMYTIPFARDNEGNVILHSHYFDDSLCIALEDYQEILNTQEGNFAEYLESKQTLQETLTSLTNELTVLNEQLLIIEDTISIEQTNQRDTDDLFSQKYAKEIEIENKQEEIDDINSQITVINNNIIALRDIISMESNFTSEQIIMLNKYSVVKTINNEYIDSAKDLYDWGKSEFVKMLTPELNVDISVVNLLSLIESQHQWDVFLPSNAGDIIKVYHEKLDININSKIIQMIYSFKDHDCELKISNVSNIKDDKQKFIEMINKSITTSNVVNMDKYKWNNIENVQSDVQNILNNAWDASLRTIVGSANNSVEFGRQGIVIRNSDDTDKALKIINGAIGITNNNFNTLDLAIDSTGIYAQKLVGQILLTSLMTITNESGNFYVDNTGATIEDMTLLITREDGLVRILLNAVDGIMIQKKVNGTWDTPKNLFSVDENGNIIAVDLTCQNFKLVNDNGGTVLEINSDPNKNTIDFDNFNTKFGKIYADNLNINGMSIADELGKVWTEINQKGQIINSTNSGLDFIDRDGINAIVIKGEPNKCYGSSFESKDSTTNIPSYWSGGQCSTDAVFSGTYSMKLEVNEISQQQQVNNEGFVDSSWFSGQDARISFRQKIGAVRVSCLKSDNFPLNLIDDSKAEIVYNEDGTETINNLRTGTSLDFTYVDEWRNGYRTFKVDLSSYPIGKFYLKFQNIDATNPTYLDQVQIESNYLNKSTIYSDGPRSFSVSELPIDLVSEDFIADWNSSGVIFNFVKMYTDYPNAHIRLSYSNRSEITTQITFSYSPIITNVNGIDYYTGITVYPDGNNLPASITNGKINAIVFSRGMVNQ